MKKTKLKTSKCVICGDSIHSFDIICKRCQEEVKSNTKKNGKN